MEDKNKETILGPMDTAILFTENGDIEALIPNQDDADVVPGHVLNAIVVMELIANSDEFHQLFYKKFDEMFKKDEETE